MEQIKTDDQPPSRRRWQDRLADAVKWWAEHQAWPATDDIRIDRNRPTCG